MHSRGIFFMLILLGLALAFDVYAYQVVRAAVRDLSANVQRGVTWVFWSLPVLTIAGIVYYFLTANNPTEHATLRAWVAGFFFGHFLFVLVLALFAGVDDIRRGLFWLLKLIGASTGSPTLEGLPMTRSAFLSRAALAVAAVPGIGMVYGVAAGGHRYRIHRKRIVLPKLPAAFEGYKIVQISDVHSGSFFSRAGVQKGIDLINKENADLVVFTGDLVNNVATEIEPWLDMFKQLRGKDGVYSTLGNHDYGDYVQWDSREAKAANLRRLMDHHAGMGWNLLLDEHRWLERGGERIALLGIQNWGARAGFPKYGNLAKAHRGTDAAPVKILLSHDPSHWRAQVLPEYPDIDLMLAGHTHGMQFGIDNEVLKWSPVKYVYPEWADLYSEGPQHLYVNRGFGFIGYPGRFGIWPEITVLELTRSANA